MAEGGQPPTRTTIYKYYINIGASKETTTTTVVHGDQVQTKNKVRAREIGTVVMSPGQNVGIEEADLAEEVQQMNLDQVPAPDTASDGSRRSTVQRKSARLDEKMQLKIIFLKERCSVLLSMSEYEKASSILEDLRSRHGTTSLDVALQMAECYLHRGEENKADEAIREIKNIITTSQFTADDVYNLGSELVKTSSFIRAIILLRIASDMYAANASSPDSVINNIFWCISKTDDAVTPMIEAGDRAGSLGVDYGIEFMIQMSQKIKDVKNANPDIKAPKEAWSMNLIARILSNADDHERSLEISQTGVKVLEQRFGSNSSKHSVYGQLLHNIGSNLYLTKRFSEAEVFFVRAVEAEEKATDFGAKNAKQEYIELSKNNLKATRAKLGKN